MRITYNQPTTFRDRVHQEVLHILKVRCCIIEQKRREVSFTHVLGDYSVLFVIARVNDCRVVGGGPSS